MGPRGTGVPTGPVPADERVTARDPETRQGAGVGDESKRRPFYPLGGKVSHWARAKEEFRKALLRGSRGD